MQGLVPTGGEALIPLGAAAAAGLIVGMERGWSQRERPDGARVTGFRTFGLLGLIGGLAGMLPDVFGAVLLFGAAAALVVGYRAEVREDALSATTVVTGLLTLAIGVAAIRISMTVALGIAGASFALLRARQSLHGLLRGLAEREIEAVARFLLVALVVLPLLPDATFGPLDAWNPRGIWMVVVMVTGLSFAGYVAARRFGSERGIAVVAITGALVSSTAVTASYARRLKTEPEARESLVGGIALASLVMFLRVQVVALVLVPRAVPTLALTLLPGTLVSAGFAAWAWRRQRSDVPGDVKLGNPFDFGPALLLALLVAVLSLAARWALAQFGDHGMAVVLALTGMMDVDAAVMTLSGLPRDSIANGLAGVVLAGPVLANTAIKGAMAMTLAPGRDGVRAALPLFAACVASAGAVAAWWLGMR